jgi:hypothetical protein
MANNKKANDERRRRCFDVRRDKLDNKRRRLEAMKHELDQLTQPSLESGSGLNLSDLSSTASNSSNVVVSLPTLSARKSARKMTQDPISAMLGRREAKVLARVNDLQHTGLWAGKKLAKINLPARPKTHWDFVIEEMNWLSSVFRQEIKTKKIVCKKCAKMVQKHFTDKEVALVKAEKSHEQNLRRIAANYSKDMRGFWGNVEKLFEYGVKTQIEAKRKQALDLHLNFIVDKTERFSTMLAESMADQSNPTSLRTTPNVSEAEMDDQDDYAPDDQNSDDDEDTIARDEDAQEDGEIDMLNADADIPIEDLLKKFHPELFEGKDNADDSKPADHEQDPVEGTSSSGIIIK